MQQFDQLLKKAAGYNSYLDKDKLIKAYDYAQKKSNGIYRLSGDPLMTHYLAVMDILMSFKPDEDTLIAGLLHGCHGLPDFDEKEFESLFGEKVLNLVTSVATLKNIKSRSKKVEAESIRRMFVAMAKDLRVILIKIADRLHNMETLAYQPASKQKLISRETLDIYVPIASRLGIYTVKGRLEDLAFRYLYPKQFEELSQELHDYLAERESTMDDIKQELGQFLIDHDIEAEIEGRIKNLYSIYNKLKLKSHSTLRDLYDVFALRIILQDKVNDKGEFQTDHLYGVLGLIHSQWRPVGQRFKDYVAIPKSNGYSSLHTAVLGLSKKDSQVTEIQIRTKQMHEEAEFGLASHWVYKQNVKAMNSAKKDRFSVEYLSSENPTRKYVDWINVLSKVKDDFSGGKDMIEALKIDAFSDRIFVMSQDGDVQDLPKGSTIIDFAYAMGMEIGHRCSAAKVNNSTVPLDYCLKNGEIVEIIEQPKEEPKSNWLSFVKTSLAKRSIKTYFRSLDEDKSYEDGLKKLNDALKKYAKRELDDDLSLFRKYKGEKLSYKEREKLVLDVGNGVLTAKSVLEGVFGVELFNDRKSRALQLGNSIQGVRYLLPRKNNIKKIQDDQVFIAGEAGMPYRLANCCKPRPGLSIIGYINRNNIVTVHLQKCKILRESMEDRMLEAVWGSDIATKKYEVKLKVLSKGRTGLIRDIAEAITGMNVNILFFSDTKKAGEHVSRDIVVEVSDNKQLDDVMFRLQAVTNIHAVTRAD